MTRANDSTIEGVGRAIDDAAGILDRTDNNPLLPVLTKQLLALNRLTDVAESLQAQVAVLERRVRDLENRQ